jgi:xanthine dehydrogenase YagR molybdenum-binding subunit
MAEWPKKTEILGTSVPRVDGAMKVTGAAKYSSDMQPDGWLYAMILRSKWPAAVIRSISLEKAKAMPGIKAAAAVKDGERTVRFYGEELAAVAGVSKQACLDALRAIEVDATPQPFVVDPVDAINPDAPRVFSDAPNLGEAKIKEEGDIAAAFAKCDVIVEGEFSTQVQLHQALETHGNTVHVKDDSCTAWASTQGIFSVRDGLAGNLNIPQHRVRVITDFMGGGFGAKFGPGVEGSLAAKLSRETGLPVKLMLTRFDESLAVGNRPSSYQKIKLGADKEGNLLAFDLDAFGSAGFASGGGTAGGGGGAGFPAPYIYKIPNVRAKHAGVAINAGSARAFRAPGHPQGSFGMESILDDVAVKLGMDPIDIRIKNDPFEIRRKEYAIGREKFGWAQKYRKPGTSSGPIKTGVGVAGATWGGGGKGTKAQATINPDGTVEVRCGTQDLGTGARTVVAMIAAEIFGIPLDRISAKVGDTDFPPSGGSGGSTTTPSISPAIFDVCTKALKELEAQSGVADARGANFAGACRKLGMQPVVAQGEWIEGLSSSGAGGVQFAEVEVDTETGFVKVKKILVVQDCGLIVNRLTAESQVNGGVITGLGYALYEQRVMDSQTGVCLNPNFETYKLPGAADIPDIEIVMLDMPERGVIGLGEPVVIPTASAVANAVANAIGVRVRSLPITPDKVLEALDLIPDRTAAVVEEDLENSFAVVGEAPAVEGDFTEDVPA